MISFRQADLFKRYDKKFGDKPAVYLLEDDRDEKKVYNAKTGEFTINGEKAELGPDMQIYERGDFNVIFNKQLWEQFEAANLYGPDGYIGHISCISNDGMLVVNSVKTAGVQVSLDPLKYCFHVSGDQNSAAAQYAPVGEP